MDNNNCKCCCKKKNTPRKQEDINDLRKRINRITGQLGGIMKMIDENRYCGDILTQIAAVESALQSVGYIILKKHMETCLIEEIQNGNTDITDETFELIKKLK